MDERDVFIAAEEALADVIDGIADSQWESSRPAWFAMSRDGDFTLREIINYHAFDTAWVPDTLAGRTVAEAGDAHTGDLLGADPKGSYRALSRRAVEAVRQLEDLDRVVHLSYGDHSAREYLQHMTSFRGFRVYDLSRWIGADTTMPPALVQGMWQVLEPHFDEWRAFGVFGPEIPVPPDAPLQDRLLGRAGREPRLPQS